MKKIITIILVLALVAAVVVGLVACKKSDTTEDTSVSFAAIAKDDIKFGLITLHDENSTYDKNFIDAAKQAIKDLGLKDSQLIIKSGVAESDDCYQTAADLVGQGCNIIFADSFGHEPYLLKAAKEFPNVRFAHATGTTAHTELVGNFYNAFASIYEGRYLAGIAAGMKLNAMNAGKAEADQNFKMGYVGAYTYAEVISGLTSFYLGAKSVCPKVTMDVQFTGSWYDVTKENEAAKNLISKGCALISQHADSMGAPNACKEAGVPNVTYNVSTKDACPDSYLIGSKINWVPYYTYLINCTINGVTAVGFDWCGGIAEGAVQITELNTAVAAEGTQEAIDAAKAKFASGELEVFDVANFTVDGKALETKLADVDTDDAFTPDTQVILTKKVGDKTITYFNESGYRSAPYFDIQIDGINFLNKLF